MSKPHLLPDAPSAQGWMGAVLRVAAYYRIAVSPEQVRIDLAWSGEKNQLRRLARSAGLGVEEIKPHRNAVSKLRLPVIADFGNGEIGVIERETKDGFGVVVDGMGGLETPFTRDELFASLQRLFVLRPVSSRPDLRIDDYIAPWRPDWLRSIVLADMAPYRSVMIASLVANTLALAGVIFSMQVYDRVVPAQSMNTLYVLFIGAMMAMGFALVMKIARGRITDVAGKAADLKISDRVFGHALRVRNTARPRSTGTFISQVRELEHVREMLTSTTVAAVADVPFFLLFCALFYYIAGPLVWIPLVAMVLLVLPGLLAQKRLRRLAEANTRESALRSAMLVEAIQGLDDIKALQAETRFQNLWNHYNETTAGSAMELRDLVGRLTSWAQSVQGGVFAVVIFFGAPMVMAGDMSTGVLVAASMLSSRMLAPLASVTQILNRWQQARVAREALDGLMALPVDSPEEQQRIHKPSIHGAFRLKSAVFGHDPQTPVLKVGQLRIAPGERIAILGRNGAGKSTLLSGLAGLLDPLQGEIRVDDVVMGLVDPADLRRDIGFMGQGARLFHGTLRENLTLGAPGATDEAILAALGEMGLDDFIRKLPDGLDHLVQEGGLGLSGGQRQGLLLARLLLRDPNVLLLDEPTASLDEVSEASVIEMLSGLEAEVSVIVATHRPAVLRMVDRLIVVSNGTIAMDGPKEQVLAQLRSGKVAA
ncbi:type I secretion system permease/ATPase [Qingshengfaniella alkalisoli]|uniref:Type I secretion system permease/ATPase n=1 Tax=Qingshengfaniella alkalisoli TaxID=2599296 RepID=A0A5B8J4G1_9RHOB|nr:type I secretion system permease/ATPase [Qingshengfaniella alkalisoli]QDY69417.1 type I secretion system permease/ATPase [Qingshengfaniella alkalisoli]